MNIRDLIALLLALMMFSAVCCATRHNQKLAVQNCHCVNNLRSINGGLEQFAIDHNGWLTLTATNNGGTEGFIEAWQYYRALSNYFTTATLVCPTDTRKPAQDWGRVENRNISYFIATKFHSAQGVVWAGDRNFTDASDTEVSLNATENYRWYTNAGIHYGKDFGVILLETTPTPTDSRKLLALMRNVAQTNMIRVAVP